MVKSNNIKEYLRNSNVWIAILVLFVCFFFTVLATTYIKKIVENEANKEFKLICSDLGSKINARLHAHAELLRSGSALFAASDSITRSDWRDFYITSEIGDNLPGIQGFGFSYIIKSTDLKEHCKRVKSEGFPDYKIKPERERSVYTSIIYLEPFTGRNLRAFGFDMFSEPTRRKAMEQSRDLNEAILSGKVTLVQETNKDVQAGALMYVPVYKKGLNIDNIKNRRDAIVGWIYSPYRMNDLMKGILGRWDSNIVNRIQMQVYDERISLYNLMFDSQKNECAEKNEYHERNVFLPLNFNGKIWQIHFSQYISENSLFHGRILVVLLCGIIISILLFSLTLALLNTRLKAHQIASILTSELNDEKERFQVILNSSAEAIYGLDAQGNCTFANKTCITILGFANENQLLGKNMHNLIHHSHIDGSPYDVHDCKIHKAFEQGQGTHVDDEVLWRADRKSFPVEYWSYPIIINGEISGAVVSFFDIAERKKAEAALRDSEQRWEYALEGGGNGVWDWDMRSDTVFYSKQWKEILGLENIDITNNLDEWSRRVNSEDLPGCVEALQNHIDGKTPSYINIYRFNCNDGTEKWILDSGKIMGYDENKKPIRMIGTITDISERIKMEEALKQSEAKYSAILHTLPDMMFIQNLEGEFIDYYAPQNTSTYIPPEVFLGKKMSEVLPHEIVNDFMRVFYRALQTKEMQLFEYSLFVKDKLHYYEARIINYESEAILSIVRDITESKNAQEILDQTRKNYEDFFNSIEDFLFVLDEQGNIIHTNDTVNRRLEYSVDELMGKSVLLVHPEERRAEAGRIVGEMLAGTAAFCPVPIVTKSGKQIDVETRVSRGTWDGRPVLFGVTKDISQIKRSEEKFSKAFHSNSALMALSSFETGNFIDVNDSFLRELEYTKEEVLGKNSKDLHLFVDFENRTKVINELNFKEDEHEIEIEIQTKSGIHKVGLFSAEKIYVGSEQCLLTTMIDVTYRKEAEKIITQQNSELQKLNIDKDRFISILAHDLRSPFNAILGFTDILIGNVRENNIEENEKYLHIVYNSAKQTFNLLNELLTWARSQSGKLPFEPQDLILSNVCEEIIENLQIVAQAKDIKIKYVSDMNVAVFADNNMLHTVLRNLISNAIKFTNSGGKILIYSEQNNDELTIAISDNGIGIEPEVLHKIFNISEVHTTPGTANEKGTGLGLLLCKEFVEKHGGKIWVESEVGKGSDFKFTIPRKQIT